MKNNILQYTYRRFHLYIKWLFNINLNSILIHSVNFLSINEKNDTYYLDLGVSKKAIDLSLFFT